MHPPTWRPAPCAQSAMLAQICFHWRKSTATVLVQKMESAKPMHSALQCGGDAGHNWAPAPKQVAVARRPDQTSRLAPDSSESSSPRAPQYVAVRVAGAFAEATGLDMKSSHACPATRGASMTSRHAIRTGGQEIESSCSCDGLVLPSPLPRPSIARRISG